jgi:antitoxin (DNA-binding transcriptional repressor) of toxin-antitoxin stability system
MIKKAARRRTLLPPERNASMATTIEVRDLHDRFAEVLSLAAAGTEVILTEGQIPRARLVPLAPGPARVPGLHPGAIRTADDFDAPLPEDFWAGTP